MTVVKKFMVVLTAFAAVTTITMFLVSWQPSRLVENHIEIASLSEDDTDSENNGNNQPLPLNVKRENNMATVEHHVRLTELKENSDTVELNKREHEGLATFNIKKPLLLPYPYVTPNVEELLKHQWVKDLKKTLSEIPNKSAPISLVSSNYLYRHFLVNWLIGAKTLVDPPISNVIVFALDQELCTEILLKRKFKECIYVKTRDMLTETVFHNMRGFPRFRVDLTLIMVLRLTAMRLLNHWGFDVANYDTDAIVLKNPESLYYSRDSDMVASHGTKPPYYSQKWGAAICCGMFMTKSSPKTEMYWNSMSNVEQPTHAYKRYDDQLRVNTALDSMQPVWEGNRTLMNITMDEWTSTTREGFKVTILPEKDVCRKNCTTKSLKQCYVWHKYIYQDRKLDNGKSDNLGLWYLRDDWEEISAKSNAISEEWLREITIL